MKRICFRFDIDTYLCASKGVPNLIRLGKQENAHFSLFCNMGRGVDLGSYLRPGRHRKEAPGAAKLSNLTKLGWGGYLKTALFNPAVGKSYPSAIREAYGEGHEIGLHGGRNHGEWMSRAARWSEGKIDDEVSWGMEELRKIGVESVVSFSSPGWQGSEGLHDVLRRRGFRIVADEHGRELEGVGDLSRSDLPLYSVPTNLLGEPGGIGYLEHMRARGMTDSQMLDEYEDDLSRVRELAILYDHPYFAGIRELPILRSMIRIAREKNFGIMRIRDIPAATSPS